MLNYFYTFIIFFAFVSCSSEDSAKASIANNEGKIAAPQNLKADESRIVMTDDEGDEQVFTSAIVREVPDDGITQNGWEFMIYDAEIEAKENPCHVQSFNAKGDHISASTPRGIQRLTQGLKFIRTNNGIGGANNLTLILNTDRARTVSKAEIEILSLEKSHAKIRIHAPASRLSKLSAKGVILAQLCDGYDMLR